MSQEQQVTFDMTAWSLWKKCNLKLWKDKHESVDNVLHCAFVMLHTWQQARRIVTSTNTISQANRNIIWQPQ